MVGEFISDIGAVNIRTGKNSLPPRGTSAITTGKSFFHFFVTLVREQICIPFLISFPLGFFVFSVGDKKLCVSEI